MLGELLQRKGRRRAAVVLSRLEHRKDAENVLRRQASEGMWVDPGFSVSPLTQTRSGEVKVLALQERPED